MGKNLTKSEVKKIAQKKSAEQKRELKEHRADVARRIAKVKKK